MVRWSRSPRRWRALARISRTSFTLADTAERASKAAVVVPAMSRASVVLPVPGGPQRMTELQPVALR